MNEYKTIEGSTLRQALRNKNLPGGYEKLCCGGRKSFSRDYESQLRALKWTGSYKILENGVLAAKVTI